MYSRTFVEEKTGRPVDLYEFNTQVEALEFIARFDKSNERVSCFADCNKFYAAYYKWTDTIPLGFDRHGNMKYWISTNDRVYGFSLWRYESSKETQFSKLVKRVPSRFSQTFKNLRIKFESLKAETIKN